MHLRPTEALVLVCCPDPFPTEPTATAQQPRRCSRTGWKQKWVQEENEKLLPRELLGYQVAISTDLGIACFPPQDVTAYDKVRSVVLSITVGPEL